AFEAAVRGGVGAFAENGLDARRVQFGMKIGAGAAGDAVRRPGRGEVGLIGEVIAGADVKILGWHHVLVSAFTGQVAGDGGRQGRAAGDRQRSALTKVVLYVDDDQRSHAIHHKIGRAS